MIRVALLLALACAWLPEVLDAAPAGWRVVSRSDGIEVAVRPNERPGLPEFRAEAEVAAPLVRVLAVIYDADRHCRWMASCRDSRLLGLDDPWHGRVYFQRATPWPVADRAAVLNTRLSVLEPGRKLRFRFTSTAEAGTELPDGVQRMNRLEGTWTLERLDPTRTRVVYRVDVDPGLSLPGFMMRSITERDPHRTLVGLRRRSAEDAERHAEFEAQWAPRIGTAPDADAVNGSGASASP